MLDGVKSYKSLLGAATVLTVIGAGPAFALTNLIDDGSFAGGATAGNYTTYSSGSALPPGGWTVTTDKQTGNASSVDLVGTHWGSPPAGGGSVDLNGTLGNDGASKTDSVGGITQSVDVAKAGTYTLSFYVSGNQDGPAPTKEYEAFAGTNSFILSTSNNVKAGQWSLVTESVFLNAGANSVGFYSLTTDPTNQYGAVIGDVSLSAVPEPSTWALMILGFLGLGFAGYRKGKSGFVSVGL